MDTILALVPARAGSKRLAGKNLRELAGLSLIGWTARTARAAGIRNIMLSTDDPSIAEEGRRQGLSVPFLRPAELSGDDVPTLPVILHALDWHRAAQGQDPDAVMLLQPTSPFRSTALIADGLDQFRKRVGADSLVAVKPLHVRSNAVFTTDAGFLRPLAPNTPEATAYIPSGALYIASTATVRHNRTLVTATCLALVHEGLSALDVDDEYDWLVAEAAVACFIQFCDEMLRAHQQKLQKVARSTQGQEQLEEAVQSCLTGATD
ncbi:MAG: acylneuraminate cytidylyltransferase family protein, partial [Rhodospirillales bacterium]|nr:acylneuraminate cytidylyltransferase family protein [Rhodospirillales bacterium]